MYELRIYDASGEIDMLFIGDTKEECRKKFTEYYGWKEDDLYSVCHEFECLV